MTHTDNWSAFAKRVSLAFPFPIAVLVEPHEDGERAIVAVELTVPERDTRESITVKTRQACIWSGEKDAIELLLHVVDVALRHEVHEALLLDGKRIMDPHRTLDTLTAAREVG